MVQPVRRLTQLVVGLWVYGLSMAFLVRSSLGVMPWDVLHQGIARHVHWSLGTVVIVTSAIVLVGWIPLRQRPGIGTIANALLIGVAVNVWLALLPHPRAVPAQAAFAAVGIGLNALATAAYIGAGLGPGPRDGLMTGLVSRTRWQVRPVRTAIEVVVVGTGWLLGGSLGIATVAYALSVGPLIHLLLPRLAVVTRPAAVAQDARSTIVPAWLRRKRPGAVPHMRENARENAYSEV